MSIRMLEKFVAETDDKEDFKVLLETALKVKFHAFPNDDPERQIIQMFRGDVPHPPGYWCINDDKDNRNLVCVFHKYVSDKGREHDGYVKFQMQREEVEHEDRSHRQKWTNYGEIIDYVMGMLEGTEPGEMPEWIATELKLDGGSNGISYKIECDHNQMYISVGHCFYGK